VILFPVVAADLATVDRSAILSRQWCPSHVEIDNDAEPASGPIVRRAGVRMTFGYAQPREATRPRWKKMLAGPEHYDHAPCSGRLRIVRLGNGWNAAKDRAA
jgi:hypothetical protein